MSEALNKAAVYRAKQELRKEGHTNPSNRVIHKRAREIQEARREHERARLKLKQQHSPEPSLDKSIIEAVEDWNDLSGDEIAFVRANADEIVD